MTSLGRTSALLAAVAVLAVTAAACGSSEPEPYDATDVVQPEPDPVPPPPDEPAPPAQPPVTVTPGETGPLPEGPAVTVKILAPRRDQVIKRGAVKVRLQVRNWQTAAAGPHVHVILDNEPYRRIDDPSQPIDLGELPEGTHWLRVFPSRASHESVKTEGAFAAVRFFVGARPADTTAVPSPNPTLTYSRPTGTYEGEAMRRLLLDFFLTDVELAPTGSKVHYWIDGANEGDITAWVPHYIENLAPGQHRITLELRDAQNAPIPGPFNRTEREITLSATATAADAAEHAH
jgi:hypothetical protein